MKHDPAPSYGLATPDSRSCTMRCSATARAALSAKMPALGTGALVTSPIAYTFGKRVERFALSTGIHPSRARPEVSTTAGTRCTGMPSNRSYCKVLPSDRCTVFVWGSIALTPWFGTQLMFRSWKRARTASEAGPDAGIGMPHGETTLRSMPDRTPRSDKNSSSNIAASHGAGGHLNGSLTTATMTLPEVTFGSTSRNWTAPSTE